MRGKRHITNRIVIAIAMVLVIGAAVPVVQSIVNRQLLKELFSLSVAIASVEEIPFTVHPTGSFIAQRDEDTIKAQIFQEGDNPIFGRLTYHGVGIFSSSPTPTSVTCPNGNLGSGWPFLAGGIVVRTENGDLIRARFDSGTSCFDPATDVIFLTLDGIIIGGTGEFSGARGSLTTKAKAKLVIGGLSEGHTFGSIIATGKGTITLK